MVILFVRSGIGCLREIIQGSTGKIIAIEAE